MLEAVVAGRGITNQLLVVLAVQVEAVQVVMVEHQRRTCIA
jgi:hypothetical protein